MPEHLAQFWRSRCSVSGVASTAQLYQMARWAGVRPTFLYPLSLPVIAVYTDDCLAVSAGLAETFPRDWRQWLRICLVGACAARLLDSDAGVLTYPSDLVVRDNPQAERRLLLLAGWLIVGRDVFADDLCRTAHGLAEVAQVPLEWADRWLWLVGGEQTRRQAWRQALTFGREPTG